MDHQNQKRLNMKLLLKITIQFIFSVSAFYILIWYSSSFSIIIHPQSLTLFTHTLQRKYMFLICNGILAFLAKNSLINSSSPPSPLFSSDSQFEFVNLSETKATVSDDMIVVPLEISSSESLEEQQQEYCEEVLEAEEPKEEGITESEACMEEEEEEKGVIKLKGEGGITETEVKVTQDDEDELELAEETTMTGNEDLANTEDLNRKFEEFIRKMKEEMRIEAQRQLIEVTFAYLHVEFSYTFHDMSL